LVGDGGCSPRPWLPAPAASDPEAVQATGVAVGVRSGAGEGRRGREVVVLGQGGRERSGERGSGMAGRRAPLPPKSQVAAGALVLIGASVRNEGLSCIRIWALSALLLGLAACSGRGGEEQVGFFKKGFKK
jgi:hypothetical protein